MKTSAELINWVILNPRRNEGDGWSESWAGFDGAWLYRMGVVPVAPSIDALRFKVDALNTDPGQAPVGAVHFWSVQPYGHASVDVFGGGTTQLVIEFGRVMVRSGDELASRHQYLGWHLFTDEEIAR